jgi:hypothetical protein
VEEQHTQSVVERAYAFLEDMFGLEHEIHAPSTVPEDLDEFTFRTVAEVSEEKKQRHE